MRKGGAVGFTEDAEDFVGEAGRVLAVAVVVVVVARVVVTFV